MITLRAKFDGNVLIPAEPVDLIADQEVELQVIETKLALASENGDVITSIIVVGEV